MDQSFVEVVELSHGSALARAQKVMNALTMRANLTLARQRGSLLPPPGGSLTAGLDAVRLVDKWLHGNRENVAAISNAAAFGAFSETIS